MDLYDHVQQQYVHNYDLVWECMKVTQIFVCNGPKEWKEMDLLTIKTW